MLNSVFISVHDFRSMRKTSIHFIAAEVAERGPTRFLSLGYSGLSQRRGDFRSNLAHRANQVEIHEGVECYLWKKVWHPFNLRAPHLATVETALFKTYRLMLPAIAKDWIREADVVFIESGMAPVFIADVRRLNPGARIVYLASDDLSVVGCANTISRDFIRHYDMIDTVRLPSRHLAARMPHARNAILVPHGIDHTIARERYPDPYDRKPACVSVGSMLFDPSFFVIASDLFPEITFHIIGAGKAAAGLHAPNIVVHEEMEFANTLPFLQHANLGVAPYRDVDQSRYLVDTSLKLRQFALFGIPAVCPEFALGDTPGRFGYKPGDPYSIRTAVAEALANDIQIVDASLSWTEVVDRILQPDAYADTKL